MLEYNDGLKTDKGVYIMTRNDLIKTLLALLENATLREIKGLIKFATTYIGK